MSQELVHEHTDTDLVEAAKAGDQDAFAMLYTRYFDPIYDFILRMTRNRDEAADLAQDTFIKAMNALPGLQTGASFKSWIYTIARNTTLNRLERASRVRPLTVEDDDGEEVSFDIVDTDRFGSPEEAAEASALSSLVWEAAQGLDARQLTLLDLHLRQGLESAEIAEVMGVTKNNGYVMLNRLKKAVEESIGAYIMLNDGRKYCTTLDTALDRAGIGSMTPEVRKLVEKHVAQCDQCTERKKKLVSPLAVFGALVPVAAPGGLKEGILGEVMRQWPLPPGTGTGLAGEGASPMAPGGPGLGAAGAGGGAGGGAIATGGFRRGFGGRFLNIAIGAGSLAAVLGLLLFLPASPFALNNGGNGDLPIAPILEETPTPNPALSPTPTLASSPTVPPTSANSPPPTPEVASPSVPAGDETPAPSPTASPTQPAGTTPGNTPAPAATSTSTPTSTAPPSPSPTNTPRPTNTPTASPTPVACVPSLGANVDFVDAGSRTTAQFTLLNLGNCSVDVLVEVVEGQGWLSATPRTATLPPSASRVITVNINRDLIPLGVTSGRVLAVTQGAATDVVIGVDSPPAPTSTPTPSPTATPTNTPSPDTQAPQIAGARVCFTTFDNMLYFTAVVMDNVGVTAVTVFGAPNPVSLVRTGGSATNGTWTGSIQQFPANSWMFVATDAAQNTTSSETGGATACPPP